MEKGAVLSACGTFRYALWRIWDSGRDPVLFVALNPSTADGEHDDPTTRRCLGFAREWGRGGLLVTNLFAYRATDPRHLGQVVDPVGPENDAWILGLAGVAAPVVVAWGNRGVLGDRAISVLRSLPLPLYHLGLTRAGQPRHPLFVRATQTLLPLQKVCEGQLVCNRGDAGERLRNEVQMSIPRAGPDLL